MIRKDGLIDPLAKAKGFGSAKGGTHHWWMQRLTAIANVGLILWLAYNMVELVSEQHADMTSAIAAAHAFIAQPLSTILLFVLIINVTYHTILGLQVVIEDYITCKVTKFASLILVRFGFLGAAALGLYSIVKIAFGA